MNPVIEAIDAGHFQRDKDDTRKEKAGLYCRDDNQPWPCRRIVRARKQAVEYADQQAAMERHRRALELHGARLGPQGL